MQWTLRTAVPVTGTSVKLHTVRLTEGKKGRSGPGEVVGEAVSNEAAMMLVVDAFELLSETEWTCIDVVCCDTAESLHRRRVHL